VHGRQEKATGAGCRGAAPYGGQAPLYYTGVDQLLHRGPQLLDVGLHGQAVPLHAELVLEGWPDAEGGGDATRRLLARIGEDLVR